jgi:hypothetical protein
MNEYKEILQAIKELDNKVDGLRDEILLNREDIRYVRKLKQVTTVDNIENKLQLLDRLEELKFKGVGALVVLNMLWAFTFWYVTNKLL